MTDPINPERIHAGIDLVVAALAEAKAVKSGADPMDAMDIAEGEAAIRREYLSRPCKHCRAKPGQPCVTRRGIPLTQVPAHSCRLDAAHAANHYPVPPVLTRGVA